MKSNKWFWVSCGLLVIVIFLFFVRMDVNVNKSPNTKDLQQLKALEIEYIYISGYADGVNLSRNLIEGSKDSCYTLCKDSALPTLCNNYCKKK